MRVKEWQGEVVFLHEVAPGAADRSYGVQVARLAGLPAAVVQRAKDVLEQLESGESAGKPTADRRPAAVFRRCQREAPPPAKTDALGARWKRSTPTNCRRGRRWKRCTG